ncbi:SDR family oxidoreductase [Celeribacter halophilus]|jgi:NAD(P)-dependent dehydrogenase (short-subunit alcohol dehydrogenase family)|uniref:NAD(P)-dependent dehydrogenase, short-chain alcohol dehydrogenase family n=1 Tax=Celeribacter halophilus TaxID=576117 RepID=A0A1I3NSY3_9RHOB|nr:SDR family oxidoreductase [Celeribacter halophilus]MDO6457594.1 SDR family oxidoreductase [Celeribacter halophilus]MDO6722348.1 SDR family oxidoreductase [Celeribacter halophilus]PZX14635.1 NAD(P)-dependent dehydrogenase (short-subunit alcohol dehydrogenase family) [Celeribacter halophilus]SFJ12428.1 NAD(P)-dependent dehydrogenase, short-chain alcohol dehydrogenase family [Celeribacter halophilus]
MILADRHILVTGAARGLGAEIASKLAAEGAKLILADLLVEEGKATAQRLGAQFLPVDLADPASISGLAGKASALCEGKLDGLVNCGAIATGIGGITYDEIDIDVWDKVMQVNVRGTWLMIRACAEMLKASGSGRVVNLASDTALWGAPRLMAYTASKGAVMSMTRSYARELGPDRVGVTAVAPGILTTQSTEYVPEARHQLYQENSAVPGPQGPEEITDVIAFLLTKGALTLTGQVLPVNNGFVFK